MIKDSILEYIGSLLRCADGESMVTILSADDDNEDVSVGSPRNVFLCLKSTKVVIALVCNSICAPGVDKTFLKLLTAVSRKSSVVNVKDEVIISLCGGITYRARYLVLY